MKVLITTFEPKLTDVEADKQEAVRKVRLFDTASTLADVLRQVGTLSTMGEISLYVTTQLEDCTDTVTTPESLEPPATPTPKKVEGWRFDGFVHDRSWGRLYIAIHTHLETGIVHVEPVTVLQGAFVPASGFGAKTFKDFEHYCDWITKHRFRVNDIDPLANILDELKVKATSETEEDPDAS